ncbi:WD40 repeat domain-containing protein [Longilinea arvoryzae]|uniref:WD40 repeat domain-containing protein n=1 Tax=Longilinea arvoryzae TaxID=360412 RepID=UPI00155F6EEC|nr:hypothetical protein [Longilinea arvoryzae]
MRKKRRLSAEPVRALPTPGQQRLAGLMASPAPLLNRLAFLRLERALQTGDSGAASLLARGLDSARSSSIRRSIRAALVKINRASSIDSLWVEEGRSRSGTLLEVLLELKQPASAPPEARAFSLLRLGRLEQLADATPDLVLPLIQACEDADPQIASAARQVIGQLQKEDALDILCTHWARTRAQFLEKTILTAGYLAHDPIDVRVLTALKLNQPDRIDTSAAEIVAPLIAASRDPDEQIAVQADYLLRRALSGAALTEFCLSWSRTRDANLEAILTGCNLLPRQPQPLRLLCALKLGRLDIAQKCPPGQIEGLLSACQDADEVIRSNARKALRNLQSPESRAALCQSFIATGNTEAGQAAQDAGYLPSASEQRALFLFLTAQWQAYETLDFDQRILRALYETADANLRQRLRHTVQNAGRIDFLSILTGSSDRERAARMDSAEAGLVIQMLTRSQNWDRIWQLAQELPLARSIEILQILSANGWSPAQPDEQRLYLQLKDLAGQPLIPSPLELAVQLPAAVPLATLKIHGRVNDMAFAPDQPLMALATGSRKVVLWNFQTAQVSQVLAGFAHSVGQVAYLSNGQLACAERTNGTSQCDILTFDGQNYHRIGSHAASVTALLPLADGNLLTTGRDQKLVLWDIAAGCQRASVDVAEWPRCAAISADGRFAALVSDRFQLIDLATLTPLTGLAPVYTRGARISPGMARCTAFAPEGRELLAGQMNGQVVRYSEIDSTQHRPKSSLTVHTGAVTGICFLPRYRQVITTGAEGEIHFIEWPSGKEQARILAPLPNLTSLEISPKGEFMATGSSDNAFTLWDLRTQALPSILELPLAGYQPEQLAAIESLVQVKSLPEPVRNTLRILEALLQHRYRFDIQISEINRIQPGEFDILVDESEAKSGYNG